jgi:hypothetical protein
VSARCAALLVLIVCAPGLIAQSWSGDERVSIGTHSATRILSNGRMTYVTARGEVYGAGGEIGALVVTHEIQEDAWGLAARHHDSYTPMNYDNTIYGTPVNMHCYMGKLYGEAQIGTRFPLIDDQRVVESPSNLCFTPRVCGEGDSSCETTPMQGCTTTADGYTVCSSYEQTSGCEYTAQGCDWWYQCPLILNTGTGRWELTGPDDPVLFDMNDDGTLDRLGWPAAHGSLVFLGRDLDGNGTLDNGSELFGIGTRLPNGNRAPNGFIALAALDRNGDEQIDSRDPVWRELILWHDRNRDGVAAPTELTRVATSSLTSIGLAFHWTGRRDEHGNLFRFQALAQFGKRAEPLYDVFLRQQ